MAEVMKAKEETSEEVQHEVCGWTGTSAVRAYAEVAATAEAPTETRRDVAQVTLSTLGDVSVAASDALTALAPVPKHTRWIPIALIGVASYAVSVAFAWWVLENLSPRASFAVIPVVPVLIVMAVFWRRQRWKFRAREWQSKFKMWEEALDSLGYEAINAVNAIRANLIGFRLSNPHVLAPEHLEIIEQATQRIERAVRKSEDPVAWWIAKKTKKSGAGEDPTRVGEETRSRIAL
ncbi:MAG TPA: hypothetical protein VNM72_06855 [Blastocatellia bacterium]|nr:hypothetical protein [Blastocatellia bacterium]